jgi:hypothetical protein
LGYFISTISSAGVSYFLPDLNFSTATDEEMMKIIMWSKSKYRKYIAEDFDCDDFAWVLQGAFSVHPWASLPAGVIWTNKHACNFYINNLGKIKVVEPQTWAVKDDLEAWQGDVVQLVVI